jgi:hypothetical protein
MSLQDWMSRIGRSLWLVALPTLSGCGAVMVAAGPSYDAGTFAVPGVKTGIGGQIEVIRYPRAHDVGVGLGASLELAGHSTANDADPLFLTTFEVRCRRPFHVHVTGRSGPYWQVGGGGAIAWSAGIRAAAVPVQAEIGVQRQVGSLLLSVGARERFVGLVGTGSPPLDALNSLQLLVGVQFGTRNRSQ